MNARDRAVLAWCEKRRPDLKKMLETIVTHNLLGTAAKMEQALYLILCIAFDAGRQFQADHHGVAPDDMEIIT